jgi:hypothetical protein
LGIFVTHRTQLSGARLMSFLVLVSAGFGIIYLEDGDRYERI